MKSLKVSRLILLVAATALLTAAAGCGGSSGDSGGGSSTKINLVAYSTPAEAYAELIPAFQNTADGKDVDFSQSYGSSGDQSRAVEAGQDADFLHFALEPDITREVDAGLVNADWDQGQYKGVLVDSVVVFVVRKGNPKNIHTWDDLTKSGVEVITPNPFTSGGARWNVMAAYGAQLKEGKTPAEAQQYLYDLFKNVPVQDDSARKALQTFTSGKGDVMLAYENEAIFAQQKGQDIDYVVPDSTILIENPAAITSTTKHPEQAKAFLDFVRSPQAQQIFAENGYRPVVSDVESPYDFPTPTGLFTIADLGGWTDVTAKFFDPKGSIMSDVEAGIGVSVG